MDQQNPDVEVEVVEPDQLQQQLDDYEYLVDRGFVPPPLNMAVNPFRRDDVTGQPVINASTHRMVIYRLRMNQRNGLTAERIEKFEHFDADELLVGETCLVCMSDLEVGTKMVRLDCHVDHYLCKTCAHGWFKNHKTCPTCRLEFN